MLEPLSCEGGPGPKRGRAWTRCSARLATRHVDAFHRAEACARRFWSCLGCVVPAKPLSGLLAAPPAMEIVMLVQTVNPDSSAAAGPGALPGLRVG